MKAEQSGVDPTPEGRDTVGAHRDEPTRRPLFRRPGVRVAVIVIGLLLCWAGWVGFRILQAADHLAEARADVAQLRAALVEPAALDASDLTNRAEQIRSATTAGVEAARDPLVRAAGWWPVIGDDLRAVADLASAADDVAAAVLPALLSAAELDVTALTLHDGRLDLDPVLRLAPELRAADEAATRAADRVAALDPTALVGPLSRAAEELRTQLDDLRAVTGPASLAASTAETLFSSTEPVRFLVMVQNLAEPRATGGIPGSSIVLTVTDDRISIGDQLATSRALEPFEPPLTVPGLDLPDELYHGLPLRFPTDTTMTPEFPAAAEIFHRMHRDRTGIEVDGVLSLDPVAVADLLSGRPPLQVPGRPAVPTDRLVEFLLSTAYQEFGRPEDAPARDLVLGQVTAAAFQSLLQQDTRTMVRAVVTAVADHRLRLWLVDPDLQEGIAATSVAGSFARTDDFGVFRNDGTGGKLGYFSSGAVDLTTAPRCVDGGRPFTLTVSLDFRPPAHSLPEYVLGHAKAGPGVLRTNVMVFVPPTAGIDEVTVDGRTVPTVRAVHLGRPVAMVTVDQRPGAASQLVVTGTTPPHDGEVVVTPGVATWPVTTTPVAAC